MTAIRGHGRKAIIILATAMCAGFALAGPAAPALAAKPDSDYDGGGAKPTGPKQLSSSDIQKCGVDSSDYAAFNKCLKDKQTR